MAILTAYFDAAGDNKAGGAVTVGGFVSDVRAWSRFEKRWRAALDRFGILDFHMTDFVSGGKGFETYRNRPDLQANVFAALTPIVQKNVRISVAVSVLLDDWNEVNQDYCLHECRFTPYAIAAFWVMDATVRWIGSAARKGHRFGEIVFEAGDTGQGDFRWYLDEGLKTAGREKYLIKSIYPLFKPKSLLPLQACDFAMWEKRRFVCEAVKQSGSALRPTFDDINKIPQRWGLMRKRTLIERAEVFGVPKRGDSSFDLRSWRPILGARRRATSRQ